MIVNIRTSLKKVNLYLPIIGILAFFPLYIAAATLYPGGTSQNKISEGYSFSGNYWCDLFDTIAYNGQPNPGRPFAIISMVVLLLAVGSFWTNLPKLISIRDLKSTAFQLLGFASLFSYLIVLLNHDLAINLSVLFGSLSFLVYLRILQQQRDFKFLFYAFVITFLIIINYLLWTFDLLLSFLPVFQKVTFLLFSLWIIVTSISVIKKSS